MGWEPAFLYLGGCWMAFAGLKICAMVQENLVEIDGDEEAKM